jgi:hypothetical protein
MNRLVGSIVVEPCPSRRSTMRSVRRVLPFLVAAVVAMLVLGRRSRARATRKAQGADPAFMFAMHGAFRRDLDRLVRQSDTPTAHTLDGWDVLRRQLESHHRAEDEDLWPIVRAHVESPLLDVMAREHAEILPAIDRVQLAIDEHRSFHDEARALQQLVNDHLDHEERDVLPLIARHLDEQEWHDWLVKERGKHPPRERVEFLGWVLDDAEPNNADAVLRELPPPGRVVYRRVLEPRYRRRQLWAA